MKKIMFTAFLLIQTILFSSQGEQPDYKSYILGDSHGKIYFKNNENAKLPLASVTKMMNIMVVFDEINKGNISLDDEVVIDWEIVSVGGSSIPMKSGEVFTLRDLIKAAAIKSANNAAYAIAKHAGKGSINDFVAKMNAKAKDLGLENELEFYTPAGLPAHMTKKPMDVGTARGIYELSREAIKYKGYMQYASLPKATIKNGEILLRSTNHLLGKDGIYGIKTGYHTRSGFNIAIASNKEGIDTIVVVL
ncbi:MAG: serine hydrolase, partial [Cetobacterium sp.]